MSDGFKPYDQDSTDTEFTIWDWSQNRQDTPDRESEEEAINELDILKQEAQQEGYQKGKEAAHEEIDALKLELTSWIDYIKRPVRIIDEQVTQEMVRAIVSICQNCIAVELSVHPEKIEGLLKRVQKELPSLKEPYTLKMHPEDMEWIKTHVLPSEIAGLVDILQAEPQLSRGDFYLQGEHSELDGKIETRITTLFEEFITKEDYSSLVDDEKS